MFAHSKFYYQPKDNLFNRSIIFIIQLDDDKLDDDKLDDDKYVNTDRITSPSFEYLQIYKNSLTFQ